ncbi:MAG TPA: hypothetical protein VN155_04730 [Devosia sp.]|nr:hypothetical protein [Devosia sp.]
MQFAGGFGRGERLLDIGIADFLGVGIALGIDAEGADGIEL